MNEIKWRKAFSIWGAMLLLMGTSHAALITFRQGVSNPLITGNYTGVEDTLLKGDGNKNNNYGSSNFGPIAGVQSDGDLFHGLMRFNLGDLPAGSTAISDATLRIRPSPSKSLIVDVHKVLAANGNWQELTSTWNQLDNTGAGTGWAGNPGASLPGTDYDAVSLSSASATTDMEFTIPKALVQSWIDNPSSNAGLLFKLNDEDPGVANQMVGVFLSDHVSEGVRPALEVDMVVVPEPNTLSLFLGALAIISFALRRRRSVPTHGPLHTAG